MFAAITTDTSDLPAHAEREIIVIHYADIEFVVVSGVATQCILGNQCADILFVIGFNKYTVLHVSTLNLADVRVLNPGRPFTKATV
jgi:hypothetical protein